MSKKLIRFVGCGIICILSVTLFSGCGLYGMALYSKDSLDLSSKSIALFTLRTSNQLKPSVEPYVNFIEIKSRDNNKSSRFVTEKPHENQEKDFLEYLVSVDLAPGRYWIGNVSGNGMVAVIMGHFCFPLDATFELPANSIVYLGHVNMVHRKLVDGEQRAGSIFPLIDQAVSGFSGGSFDIEVSDRSDIDIPLFKEKYPLLEKFIIKSSIMNL